MPRLTASQETYGTGSQADARETARRRGLGFVPPPQGADNPYGVMGDVGLWNKVTSGVGYGPEAGAAMDVWNQAPAPGTFNARSMLDPSLLYASLFGNVTPASRIDTGIGFGPAGAVPGAPPAAPGAAGPSSGGAANAPVAPKSTPQQAGENNSLYPGWSTGNQEVGVAKAASGLALPDAGPTNPVNASLAAVPPPGPTKSATVTETRAASTGAPSGGVTITIGGQQYQVTRQPNPTIWATYSKAKQVQWAKDHAYTGQTQSPPSGYEGGTSSTPPGDTSQEPSRDASVWQPTATADSFDKNSWGINLPGHAPRAPLTVPVDLASATGENVPVTSVLAAIPDKWLQGLALELYKLTYGAKPGDVSLQSINQNPSLARTSAGIRTLRIAQQMENALNYYGVNYPLYTTYTSQLGDTTGGGTGSGGGAGGAGPDDPFGAGGGDTAAPAFPGGNTDLTNLELGPYIQYLNAVLGGGLNDPKMREFFIEKAFALMQQDQARRDQQQGVNIVASANQAFQNDPLRAKQVGIMSGILDNPDNTPWDIIEANRIADMKKAAGDAAATYGASAARRLGDAGVAALPGVTSSYQRAADNEIARARGDIAVERARSGRDAEYRALSGADALRGSTSGADVQNAQVLANFVRQQPQAAANPIAGTADAWIASNQYNRAWDAAGGGGNTGTGALLGGLLTGGLGAAFGNVGAPATDTSQAGLSYTDLFKLVLGGAQLGAAAGI